MPSPLLKPLETTLEASLSIPLVELRKIMTSVLLDGESKTELNIGSLETLGEAIGEKMEPSDSLEELTISASKAIAPGPPQLIHGLRTLETRPNPKPKKLSPRHPCMLMQHAKESLHR